MESTRITLARVLELGVRVSWREATAIVHEAVAGTGATTGAGPARVTAESCLLTRGGDVVLAGTAAQASPEAVVRLLDDLLASCSAPGRFAGAVANGTALDMLEELSEHIPPKRRRVEVAAVALRGLAAAADAARAMAEAHEQDPSADFDDVIAVPTPAASPPAFPRGDSTFDDAEVRRPGLDHEDVIAAVEAAREWTAPENAVAALALGTSPAQGSRASVTLRPASFSVDLPSATPQVHAVRTAKDVRGGDPSQFGWVVSPAALVCSILAVATSGIVVLQIPATRRSAVEPSASAIEPPAIDAPVGLDRHTPLARPARALLPEVADLPSVPPVVARSAPRGSRIADRRAPFSRVQASFVRPIPMPAGRPKTPAENSATVAGSRSLSTPSAAAAIPAPDAANLSAGAPSPAVDPSSGVASPSATASSPAATFGSASTNVTVNAVARSPGRELEARAIENVLGRYRIAFNKLDAGAASAVWPTVNEKSLAKAFERLESHDVSFASCQIEIFSVLAEAVCNGSARYVPKVGSRTPKDEARRWRFSLRKASGGWLIDGVDAR